MVNLFRDFNDHQWWVFYPAYASLTSFFFRHSALNAKSLLFKLFSERIFRILCSGPFRGSGMV